MSDDLLAAARREIVEQSVNSVVVPPRELKTLGERLKGALPSGRKAVMRGGAGAALGTAVGLNTGFAFLGTAVSGAWVLAPLFGLAVVVAGQVMDKDS